MATYPQLSASSSCQYPIRRTRHTRTITNTLEDGSRIALADPLATTVRWNLSYSGLIDSELLAIQTFFESSEGRLNTFSFADPTANLLLWSEDFSQPVWQRNSLLQLGSGAADPMGTTRATHIANTGGGDLTMTQTVPVPGAWACCWSVYLRGSAAQTVTLLHDTNQFTAKAGPSWQRFQFYGTGGTGTGSSDFSLVFPAGAAIDVFGPQVEAQASASTYIPNQGISGVYPQTRFDSDELAVRMDAPNNNSCTVSLISYTA